MADKTIRYRAGRLSQAPAERSTAASTRLIRDMTRFLQMLCDHSDRVHSGGHRSQETERNYQTAKALIARATR